MDSKSSRKSKRGQGPAGKKTQNPVASKSKVKKSVKKKEDEVQKLEVKTLDAEVQKVAGVTPDAEMLKVEEVVLDAEKTDSERFVVVGESSVREDEVNEEINEKIDTESAFGAEKIEEAAQVEEKPEGQSHGIAEPEDQLGVQDIVTSKNDSATTTEAELGHERHDDDISGDLQLEVVVSSQDTTDSEVVSVSVPETMKLDPNAFGPSESSRDDSSCADDLTPVNETPTNANFMTTSVRIQSDKEDESSSTEVWWTAREDLAGGSDEGSLRATSALSLDDLSDGLMDTMLSPSGSHKGPGALECHKLPVLSSTATETCVETRDATTLTDIVPLPSSINGHKVPESPTGEVKGRKVDKSESGHGRRGSIVRGQSLCEEFTPEDSSIVDYLVDVQDGAEARLAARRQARAEAREIRMKELEKQQKESEENADRHYDMQQSTDVVNRAAFRVALGNHHRPASHTHSLGSTSYHSSRRSSEESSEDGHMSMRDMRHELKELEDKFRKSMVQNAQLDNEKSALTYHVELLKDKIEDLEETLGQTTRDLRDKSRDCEQLKRVTAELEQSVREELAFLKYQLQEKEQLIKEYGLVVVENEVEVDVGNGERETRLKRTLVTQETADVLSTLGEGSLDVRLRKVLEEKNELMDELRRLKLDLEEEQSLNSKGNHNHVTNHVNGPDGDQSEIHREVSKQMADYKYKIQKYEQEILALQANVSRLDGQVNRFRSAAEEAETREDDLKVEKRKLQRELREAQSRLDEVETTNSHLQKRLDKLKTAKSNLLKDL